MEFSTERETLLTPLQLVSGAVEKKQTLPILSNVLLALHDEQLSLTATDSEIELIGRTHLGDVTQTGSTTVSARKLIDICRSLPDNQAITLKLSGNNLLVRSGRSRFSLATLPVDDFPAVEAIEITRQIQLSQKQLSEWLQHVYFSMAQQDVRYYLNGVLLLIERNQIKLVATDGHRLALCSDKLEAETEDMQIIIPRKGVMELIRLLDPNSENAITLVLNDNYIRITSPDFTFTSKLIDGRFPDYQRVIPTSEGQAAIVEREPLKQALHRMAILSHDKYRGVRLLFGNNDLKIFAHNSEKETAEEELAIDYPHQDIEVGLNVHYLQDVLNAIETPTLSITLIDANNSVLIEAHYPDDTETPSGADALYVIMPMRL